MFCSGWRRKKSPALPGSFFLGEGASDEAVQILDHAVVVNVLPVECLQAVEAAGDRIDLFHVASYPDLGADGSGGGDIGFALDDAGDQPVGCLRIRVGRHRKGSATC